MKHLIFDLDGTLVDSCGTCIAILSEMLDERGSDHAIDPLEARAFMSRGGADMVSALLGPDCGDPEIELASFRDRYQHRTTPRQALFAGVEDSLVQLKDAGFRLAICSNKPQNLCEKVLADTGIDHLFDVVVGRRAAMRPKPEPDLLDEVLRQLGAAPPDCIFVGDSELDHQTARTADMAFLFMTYGYAAPGWQPDDCETYGCFSTMSALVLARMGARRSAA